MKKQKNKLRVVSLFSGIGGFELGLEKSRLNGEVIFSSEIDRFARISYEANFPNVHQAGDITKVDEKKVPDHDLLLGGFPCQAFSIAGKRHGFEDTRGTLFFEIARLLKAKKPKYFLLENVANLISHDSSNTIKVILRTLSNLNYTVDFTILNSKDFGLPQNRTRTFIIGILNYPTEKYVTDTNSPKINSLKLFLNSQKFNSFNFFNTLKSNSKKQYLKDILDTEIHEKYFITKEPVKEHIESIKGTITEKKEHKIIKLFDLPKDIHNDQERQRRIYSILGISPTILARSDSTKIYVNSKIRKLTPKENLRLQGFSQKFIDNIVSTGMSDTQIYKQSGNAVSPPVVTAILNHLSDLITHDNHFTFIDLFAGIGGFRIALESLGGKCVFSSEIDKFASKTYLDNFGDSPQGDITIIDSKDIPDHDFLCAGFPCQPFSIAGKRLGFEDSRGTLFFEVARILKDKKPTGFILENVSGLVNHDKGKTLSVILDVLEEIGYTTHWKLLNAKDFNIPQNRNRWYCVGVRNDLSESVDFNNIFPEKITLTNTLSKVLEKKFSRDFRVSNIAIKNIDKHIQGYLRKIDAPTEPIIANNIRPSKVSFSSNGISPCLTAKMGTGGNNVPVVCNQYRKYTILECLRIMGFPDNFKLKENYSQSYKQLGNSVAVPVIRLIFENLLNELSLVKK